MELIYQKFLNPESIDMLLTVCVSYTRFISLCVSAGGKGRMKSMRGRGGMRGGRRGRGGGRGRGGRGGGGKMGGDNDDGDGYGDDMEVRFET